MVSFENGAGNSKAGALEAYFVILFGDRLSFGRRALASSVIKKLQNRVNAPSRDVVNAVLTIPTEAKAR